MSKRKPPVTTHAPPAVAAAPPPAAPPTFDDDDRRRLLADGPVRKSAISLAARAREDWSYASTILNTAFRESHLGQRERRLVAEAVYGQIRLHRRVDFLLEFGLKPGGRRVADLLPRERDLARYLVWLVAGAGLPAGAVAAVAGRLGPAIAALGRADEALAAIGDPLRRAAIGLSYPDWIVERFTEELGPDEAAALCAAMNARAPLVVRANTVRTTREALAATLAAVGLATEPTALAADGLRLTTHVNVFGLAAFQEGLFEVQDEGSQLVAELCAPPPGGLVIDACAGAGGKTLALAALANGRGRVVALDVDERKLDELRRRARRAGLSNVQARRPDDEAWLELRGRGDRVLCDVPCSGLGVLRRNPEARWRQTPALIADLPEKQRAILERYAPMCAPGGRIIYATCTPLAAENDAVVDGFLAAHPELEPVSAKEILGAARAAALGDGARLRLFPHRQGTDGFYAAVMRRRR